MGAVVKYSLYFSASVVCTASRYICAFSSDQSPLCPHRCLEEAEQLDSYRLFALIHKFDQTFNIFFIMCNQIQLLNIAIGKNSSHRKVLSQFGF